MEHSKHNETFGVQLMEKYGWSSGKGLGAKEDGMSEALRPNLKFDKHGLGHDIAKDIAFNWWDSVFNKALNNVGKSDEELKVVNAKEKTEKRSYSNFVKTKQGNVIDDVDETVADTLSGEMVEKCEGRTAHKGARHGIYSSGKLERVKKAESEFLNRWKTSDQESPSFGKVRTKKNKDNSIRKKSKKRKK